MWLQRRLSRLSLQDLHFYPVVFILLFTVIMASLAIYNEYQEFAHSLQWLQISSTLKTRFIKIVLEIATLALILFGFVVGISKILNALIEHEIILFLKFFESASHTLTPIDEKELYFVESRQMAQYANHMLHLLHQHQNTLQNLNNDLEERVNRKTHALQRQNQALEKEQRFSQELLESHKQFIRYAIHETNTPLSVIMANIELFTLHEGRNRYLAKIEAATKNIFSIYDDLSYLVKKDQIDYPKKGIELGEYLQRRLEFFDEVAQFSHVQFEYHPPELGVWIYFNETKLQRVIDNNITNAIKYTPTGGTIVLGVNQTIERSHFWIENPSEKILDPTKIFEAYYRERRAQDGFGLGLNLVKAICDEDGVVIDIVSDHLRTRFDYYFQKGTHENLLT